ncbi:hypothetical protein [Taibaiella chishuiensis]|uniref:Uncharacterized protein n=1 Tax=Taibaiella chishuiensis TaxID=1434707 RepID=A0A2P8CVN1_9BACT|nr:hypothetical protein [Taibaiella chishuiensis]PSK89033.1 hypothetical protein B0I18_11345 [Taibaiella chishuiensis]
MKARILSLVLLLSVLWGTSGYAQKSMTPVAFNDELVKVTETLYQLGTEWGTRFAAINSNEGKDFSQLKPLRQKLTDFITGQTKAIKQLPNTGKGAEAFKKVMLEFLVFEEGMINSGFIPMEQLGPQSTDEAIQKATQNLTDLASKEGEALDKVHKAQDQYAADNNFVIEDEK